MYSLVIYSFVTFVFHSWLLQKISRECQSYRYSCIEAKKPQNKQLNRYRDVNPYDRSRIVLQRGECDYINANLVKVSVDRALPPFINSEVSFCLIGGTYNGFMMCIYPIWREIFFISCATVYLLQDNKVTLTGVSKCIVELFAMRVYLFLTISFGAIASPCWYFIQLSATSPAKIKTTYFARVHVYRVARMTLLPNYRIIIVWQ